MQFYVALVLLLWMDGTIKDQGRNLTTSPPPMSNTNIKYFWTEHSTPMLTGSSRSNKTNKRMDRQTNKQQSNKPTIKTSKNPTNKPMNKQTNKPQGCLFH